MYEAQDLASGREYALKVIKDDISVGFYIILRRSLSDTVSRDSFPLFSKHFLFTVCPICSF